MKLPLANRMALSSIVLLLVSNAARADDAESFFHKGYYLQHSQQDIQGALEAYQQALEEGVSGETKAKIKRQVAGIKEGIAAQNFARLMPAETLAYVEVVRPAAHLEQLIRAMGLTERTPSGDNVTIELDDGFILSSDFQISPALLGELKKVNGMAAGVMGMNEKGEPVPLVVIHPGESDLVRGFIETGVQVVPTRDSIAGHRTYCHSDDVDVWIVQTEALLFISNDKEQIENAVARIDKSRDSLADQEAFQECREERDGALAFVFVDGQRLIKTFGPMMKGEAAVARMILDLDHFRRATLAVTTTESGARARARVTYDEGHHSLAYGLVRTVPFKKEALERIPSGAAMVAAIGLNPELAGEKSAAGVRYLTALDVGREFFANIEQVGLFVMPTAAVEGEEVPDFGFVVTSNDSAKSEALWNQLLSLPASIGEEDGPKMEETTIGGRVARRYTFPDDDAPVLTVTRLDDESLIAGTDGAVAAAVEHKSSIRDDKEFGLLISQTGEHTSKAVFAHIGRMLALASQMEGGSDAEELAKMSEVLSDMRVSLVSNEDPTELTVQLEASGLPQFEDVMRVVAAQQQQEEEESKVAALEGSL